VSRPDEGLIQAWLDGELDAAEAARVERLVATDAAWGAAAAEARGLVAASSRILSHLDVVAGDVIPQGGRAAPAAAPMKPAVAAPMRVRRGVPRWMQVAAGLVLVAGVSYLGRDALRFTGAPEVAAVPDAVPDAVPESVPAPMAVTADQGTAATAATPVDAGAREREVVREPASAPANAPPSAPARAAEDALTRQVVPAGPSRVARPSGSAAPASPAPPSDAAAANLAAGAAGSVAAAEPVAPPRRMAAAPAAAVAPAAKVAVRADSIANESRRAVADVRADVRADARAGVAGGVAAGAVSTVRTLGATTEPVAMRAEAAVTAELRDATEAVLTGCWRTTTGAQVDAVQRDLRIVRRAGDTLVVALLPPGAEAALRPDGADRFVGSVRPSAARNAVPLVLRRVACPAQP